MEISPIIFDPEGIFPIDKLRHLEGSKDLQIIKASDLNKFLENLFKANLPILITEIDFNDKKSLTAVNLMMNYYSQNSNVIKINFYF